jgi:hypothetical protein
MTQWGPFRALTAGPGCPDAPKDPVGMSPTNGGQRAQVVTDAHTPDGEASRRCSNAEEESPSPDEEAS